MKKQGNRSGSAGPIVVLCRLSYCGSGLCQLLILRNSAWCPEAPLAIFPCSHVLGSKGTLGRKEAEAEGSAVGGGKKVCMEEREQGKLSFSSCSPRLSG